jgi:hypothetical protein
MASSKDDLLRQHAVKPSPFHNGPQTGERTSHPRRICLRSFNCKNSEMPMIDTMLDYHYLDAHHRQAVVLSILILPNAC